MQKENPTVYKKQSVFFLYQKGETVAVSDTNAPSLFVLL